MAYSKEEKREYDKLYRAKNREKLLEQARIRYAANPENSKTATKRWREAHTEQVTTRDKAYRARRADYLRWQKIAKRHHVSVEWAQALWAEQDSCCANTSCNRTLAPTRNGAHLDHDHECCAGPASCGQCIRGWLCGPCNKSMGLVGDDAAILRGAALYLEKATHRPNEDSRKPTHRERFGRAS